VAATRGRVRELLAERRTDEIVEIAGRSRRVLGVLVSLTFDAEPRIGWRAVEAMGLAAARIADEDPTGVRDHLRRLHWLLHDESGGICWRAPEAMAEIVRHRPALFPEYVPIVVHLLLELAEEDLSHFRAGVLWAIGRLGPLASEHTGDVIHEITAGLDDPAPQVRGMAAWALGRVGRGAVLAGRGAMLEDTGPVEYYEAGEVRWTTVGRLVREATAARSGAP
jgi:hypothetical protein